MKPKLTKVIIIAGLLNSLGLLWSKLVLHGIDKSLVSDYMMMYWKMCTLELYIPAPATILLYYIILEEFIFWFIFHTLPYSSYPFYSATSAEVWDLTESETALYLWSGYYNADNKIQREQRTELKIKQWTRVIIKQMCWKSNKSLKCGCEYLPQSPTTWLGKLNEVQRVRITGLGFNNSFRRRGDQRWIRLGGKKVYKLYCIMKLSVCQVLFHNSVNSQHLDHRRQLGVG